MTEVLEAVKRNRPDRPVVGVYEEYRVQLRRILHDAAIPDGDRLALLERMKLR